MDTPLEKYSINQDVWLTLWTGCIGVSIVGVKETLNGRYKYDVIAAGRNGKEVRMYNIDCDHICKTHRKHEQGQ